jgi:uncharacterized damage-inducible protein DinB
MTSDTVRTLYRDSAWATACILEHAARLRRDELAKPSGASFGSVRETLVHITAAQWIWLARWKGTSPPRCWTRGIFPTSRRFARAGIRSTARRSGSNGRRVSG